jgi:Protein of unknown function (DUF3800)
MNSVFLNESGNTGSNLLDVNQPVFTFVGVGIKNNRIHEIAERINELKSKYNIRSEELKAKDIFRRNKDGIIREVAELLMGREFQLFINIAEKRFVIASFIESDFFDLAFNDRCDNSWTHPVDDRNLNSNFFFKHLSDQAITACGNFFSTGLNIEEAFWLVHRDIQDKEYKIPLAEILLGAKAHLEDLSRITRQVVSEDTTIHAPNYFTFCDLINKIEHYYLNINGDSLLQFDSSSQFNTSFIRIYSALKNASPSAIIAPDRIPFIAGYEAIKGMNVVDSKDSVLIQCADLLATAINRVMHKILKYSSEAELSDTELFILVLIFFHWKDFGDLFCSYVCSGELLYKMFLTLQRNVPK